MRAERKEAAYFDRSGVLITVLSLQALIHLQGGAITFLQIGIAFVTMVFGIRSLTNGYAYGLFHIYLAGLIVSSSIVFFSILGVPDLYIGSHDENAVLRSNWTVGAIALLALVLGPAFYWIGSNQHDEDKKGGEI